MSDLDNLAAGSPGTGSLGQRLERILAAQRELYLQLADLARRQSQCIATGASEPLMAVLAARSRLLDQLAPLDQQLQPFKGQWQNVLDGLPATERLAVAGLLKSVQQLLADILAQDEVDKEALNRQKTDVGAQISNVVTGTQLNRAYGIRKTMAGAGRGMGIG